VAAGLVLAATSTAAVAAAAPEWGTPQAESAYGIGVQFSQPVTLPADTARVEMLLESPGGDGLLVSEVAPGALGQPTTLAFTYDTAASHAYPNTRFTGRWRVTRADGTVDVGPSASVTYADTTHDWRTKTGELVRVHWYEGDDRFAERILAVGEEGLAKASAFLGVAESEPVDFFIYASRDDFMAAFGSGSQEWAGAFALPETRTLIGDIPPDAFDTQLVSLYVPHELAHVVFDTATANPYHEPPRWLNEGLAVYLTEGYAANWRSSLRDGVADDRLLPLGAIATVFPTAADGADLAYAESVSAVAHMVDRYGKDALVRLVRAYADGVSDDEAFTAGLGVTLAEFEADWLASIDASAPERRGPQPAPAGPVPSAWLAASPAPDAPDATAPPAGAGPTAPPDASSPAATADPGATGQASPGTAGDRSGLPLFLVTLAAVVAVIIATIVFFAWTRRRRRRPPPTFPTGDTAPPDGAPAVPTAAGAPAGSQVEEAADPAGVAGPPAAAPPSEPASRPPLDRRPAPVVWEPEPLPREGAGDPPPADRSAGSVP
jgi:hypothetical protein